MGAKAAKETARLLNRAIAENGSARIILSTGASQFTTLEALIAEDVDWSKVEMFHLDEYIGIDESHPASFVKYLKERFVSKVNLKAAYFVDPSCAVDDIIARLTEKLREQSVDVGLIGIGENAHIAFNDPPADFEDENAYKVVVLAERCRQQQLGEGWFATLADVPEKAISMTVRQILRCRHIISAVPYAVKAQAIHDTLTNDVTNMIPATVLKTHPDVQIFIDADSASMLPASVELVK
ncbi:MAG: 6-phosphogluconolactonase [Oscillospiraceae bacterium]|nr:6-phosphogluconolactonase [Oscillospiraceae bacterium]